MSWFYLQSGLTPLTLATSKSHNDVIEFLVSEANADLTMIDQVTTFIKVMYSYVHVYSCLTVQCKVVIVNDHLQEERQKLNTLVHKKLSMPGKETMIANGSVT